MPRQVWKIACRGHTYDAAPFVAQTDPEVMPVQDQTDLAEIIALLNDLAHR